MPRSRRGGPDPAGHRDRAGIAARRGRKVSSEALAFLHLGASLALWDRLLISVLLPIAVLQNGDSPMVQGVTLQSPSSTEVSDLRWGARIRLFGEYDAPFQIGAGA